MLSRALQACSTFCLVLVACGGGHESGTGGSTTSGSTTTHGTGGAASSTSHSAQGGMGGTGTASTGGAGGTGGSLGPPSASRVGGTFDIPTLAESAPKRFVDAVFDPAHDGYLVVNGNAAISASFIDEGGAPLGSPVKVAQTSAWTQGVRAGYGAKAQGFLVAWHDGRLDPSSAVLYGRIVRWDGSATTFGGNDFPISQAATYQEMAPAIAYSTAGERFLVAWQHAPGSDIHARFVSADGALIGQEIAITSDPDWQSDAAVAYNPVADEMLVSYTYAGAGAEVRVQRVGMDGSLLGAPVTIAQAAGTWMTQLAYLPSENGYLAAWYQGALRAVRLGADATMKGSPFDLAPGYGSYDGFAMAMLPASERFMAVFHGQSDEDFAAAFDASGTQSAVVQATDSAGSDGHFNPHVAAHGTRHEWLLVTSLGYHTVVGQRLGP